jgi:hypothetical protein
MTELVEAASCSNNERCRAVPRAACRVRRAAAGRFAAAMIAGEAYCGEAHHREAIFRLVAVLGACHRRCRVAIDDSRPTSDAARSLGPHSRSLHERRFSDRYLEYR